MPSVSMSGSRRMRIRTPRSWGLPRRWWPGSRGNRDAGGAGSGGLRCAARGRRQRRSAAGEGFGAGFDRARTGPTGSGPSGGAMPDRRYRELSRGGLRPVPRHSGGLPGEVGLLPGEVRWVGSSIRARLRRGPPERGRGAMTTATATPRTANNGRCGFSTKARGVKTAAAQRTRKRASAAADRSPERFEAAAAASSITAGRATLSPITAVSGPQTLVRPHALASGELMVGSDRLRGAGVAIGGGDSSAILAFRHLSGCDPVDLVESTSVETEALISSPHHAFPRTSAQ